MYKLIDYLGLLLVVILFMLGFVQFYDYFTTGSLNDCNVVGFAYVFSALFLVASLWFVDKKYPSVLNLLLAIAIASVILYFTSSSLQVFYATETQCPGFGPY